MIKSLQGLRVIFIILIMWMHYGLFLVGNAGAFCSFFFILSEFIITLKPRDEVNYYKYIKKKFIRIYPLAWIALLLAVFLRHRYPSDWSIIPHVLLIQSWIPSDKFLYFNFNGASWFLSSMLFCYLLSPFIARWLGKKDNSRVLLFGFIVLLTLSLSIHVFNQIHDLSYRKYFIYINPAIRLMEYFLGMCLGLIYYRKDVITALNKNNGKYYIALFSVIEIILLSASFFLSKYTPFGVYPIQYNLFPYVMLSLVAVFSLQKGVISQILSLKPFQFISTFSFEIYMIHPNFINLFQNCGIRNRYSIILYSLFIIAFCYLLKRYFFKKVENGLQSRFLR